MEYLNTIVKWIQDEVKKANASGVIVGISGGIDSALVSYLAKKAFKNNFLALMMPINKERDFDLQDGIELANKFNINYKIVDLYDEYKLIVKKIKPSSDSIKGNIQARLRMLTLYAYAQENNYLVLGTDNLAEYKLGYFTKYGDGGCDLLPIVHLHKSEVFEYSKKVGIPDSILNKEPSAGLWSNQTDENELGFKYDDFEKFEKGQKLNSTLKEKIQKQIKITEHKRVPIPMPPKNHKNIYMTWIDKMESSIKKQKIEKLVNNTQKKFPQIHFDIKWNQLIFMHEKTFILGISISKNYINFAPELIAVNKFETQIKQLEYEKTKYLIKVHDNKKLDINFINEIIKYNLKDKAGSKKFWRE